MRKQGATLNSILPLTLLSIALFGQVQSGMIEIPVKRIERSLLIETNDTIQNATAQKDALETKTYSQSGLLNHITKQMNDAWTKKNI